MRGERANVVVARPPCTTRETGGMFETFDHAAGTVAVSWNVARNAGSSQHGNMRRASVASNCVESIVPVPPPGSRYALREQALRGRLDLSVVRERQRVHPRRDGTRERDRGELRGVVAAHAGDRRAVEPHVVQPLVERVEHDRRHGRAHAQRDRLGARQRALRGVRYDRDAIVDRHDGFGQPPGSLVEIERGRSARAGGNHHEKRGRQRGPHEPIEHDGRHFRPRAPSPIGACGRPSSRGRSHARSLSAISALRHVRRDVRPELVRFVEQLVLGLALDVDASVRASARVRAVTLRARIGRAALALGLPVVAHFLERVLHRRPRGAMSALFVAVVRPLRALERLLVGVLRFLRRPFERRRQRRELALFSFRRHDRIVPAVDESHERRPCRRHAIRTNRRGRTSTRTTTP